MNFYKRFGKRALDVTLSATGIVLLSPVLAMTALAIRTKMGSPVIYKHSRPGKDGEHFDLYKFRTMSSEKDAAGNLLPDRDRITPLGAWLRTRSLDELPELVNVCKGDMSLVGPRPLLTRYLPYYTPHERRRFNVRPGLTGWAQVQGRNSVRWDERLSYDVWYTENMSFLLDAKILLKTVQLVFTRQGIAVVPNLAMESLDVERSSNG